MFIDVAQIHVLVHGNANRFCGHLGVKLALNVLECIYTIFIVSINVGMAHGKSRGYQNLYGIVY